MSTLEYFYFALCLLRQKRLCKDMLIRDTYNQYKTYYAEHLGSSVTSDFVEGMTLLTLDKNDSGCYFTGALRLNSIILKGG